MSRKTRRKGGERKPLAGGLGGGASAVLIQDVVSSPAAEIDQRTPGKDLKLIQSAINNGWQIRPAAMSALPDAMLRIALDKDAESRARVNAARVIVSMHGQNEPVPTSTVNVGLQVNAAEAVKAALNEPDYIRFVHARRSVESSDVRSNGDGGSLQVAGSHNGHSGSHNGHSNGSNGKHAVD